MQICIVKETLPGVVPRTIIGRSILIGHTTTCIALVAFKDVTLVHTYTPVVPYMGELVVYVPSIDTTNASTYIEVVYTNTIVVGVVETKILYRKDQVRGPPYIRLLKNSTICITGNSKGAYISLLFLYRL